MGVNVMGFVAVVAAALVVIGVIVGAFVLPDPLVMQVSATGAAGGTLPKPLGLLLPLALAAFGFFWVRKGGQTKGAVVAFVALLATVLLFVFNR